LLCFLLWSGFNLYFFDFQRLFDEVLREILRVMSQVDGLVLFEFPHASHLEAELVRALIEETFENARLHLKQPEKVMFNVHEIVIVVV